LFKFEDPDSTDEDVSLDLHQSLRKVGSGNSHQNCLNIYKSDSAYQEYFQRRLSFLSLLQERRCMVMIVNRSNPNPESSGTTDHIKSTYSRSCF